MTAPDRHRAVLRALHLWGPVIIVGLMILYLTLLPDPVGIRLRWFPHQDKVFHLVGFATFAVVLTRAVVNGTALSCRGAWGVSATLCVVFAVTDEWAQRFVPSRTVELGDIAANLCGTGLGLLLWYILSLQRQDRAAP